MATTKLNLTQKEETHIDAVFAAADIEALLALDTVEVINTPTLKPSLTPVHHWTDPTDKEPA